MSLSRLPKQRRCKFSGCRDYFIPKRKGLKLDECCSPACELSFAEETANKAFKATTAAMRKAFNDKDVSWWSDKAQAMFNKYIMVRDAGKPCTSCGTAKKDIDYCAGHYVPRGRCAALRFNEFNTNIQCNSYCNLRNSGNLIPYRQALIILHGEPIVLWLEGPHEMPRYRIEDYKRIYEEFKLKIKELKIDQNRAATTGAHD